MGPGLELQCAWFPPGSVTCSPQTLEGRRTKKREFTTNHAAPRVRIVSHKRYVSLGASETRQNADEWCVFHRISLEDAVDEPARRASHRANSSIFSCQVFSGAAGRRNTRDGCGHRRWSACRPRLIRARKARCKDTGSLPVSGAEFSGP